MSKITAIEYAIRQLGPAEFQDFCDTFLSKKGQHGKILARGKQPGFSKTTTGNPDTYFYENENGKYIFVAYTTTQDSLYSKLKKDIEKCLDPDKTGLQVKDIDEIICCHTSSNLDAGDDQKLHAICQRSGVKLTLYSINQIAQEIYQNYPILARDIGVSIDTNQIMSIEDFIKEYDASETVAPLNTKFLCRSNELESLKKCLRENKVVIVHGAAGVGKTRIVLEAIRSFSEEGIRVFCVKNRNLGLFDDLVAYTEKPGQYLFFVDDANELCGLNLILDYILKANDGYSVKIIMTVRDYVKRSVVQTTYRYVIPELFEVTVFSDKEIAEFLDVNMGITNNQYTDAIIRVAEGNPRVAFMAGKIAIDTQSLAALNDVTDVYETYYGSIIESRLANNRDLCFTAGVLALVQAVIIDKMDSLDEIIKLGELSQDEFISCIRQLSVMEVVEVHMDKYATISDQCFANYMLYYVFFAEKRVPFSKVLVIGFKQFRRGVIQSTDTLLHLFLRDSLKGYIHTEIKKAWKQLKEQKDPCFEEFMRTFHIFNPEESFLKAIDRIKSIPAKEFNGKPIDFEKGNASFDDEILGLLTGYNYSHYLQTVIDIFKNYVSKSEEKAVNGFNWFKNEYGINHSTRSHAYHDERVIAGYLTNSLSENPIFTRFILAYVSYALSYEFSSIESGRGYTFKVYTIPLVSSEGADEYRKKCWTILKELQKIDELKDEFVDVIAKYAKSVCGDGDSTVVLRDQPYIDKIVHEIKCSDIIKAKIIRDLQRGWKKHSVEYPEYTTAFDSEDWRVYTLLEDVWPYTNLEYEDYEEKRIKGINEYAESLSVNCIGSEIIRYNRLIKNERNEGHNKYSLNEGVNYTLKCFSKDFNKSLEAFVSLMTDGNDLDIRPECLFATLFNHMEAESIWKMIEDVDFPQKNQWKFYYFQMLPERGVNEYEFRKMIGYLENESDALTSPAPLRDIRFLDKYLKWDPNVYVTASKLIINKGIFTSTIYFTYLFADSVFTPLRLRKLFASDITLLKNIFFEMLEKASLVDVKGVFLADFLTIDNSWLDMYVDTVIRKVQRSIDLSHEHFIALWRTEDYLDYYNRIFYRISEEKRTSEWRIANVYKAIFQDTQGKDIVVERQEKWVSQIVKEYAFDERIICLFKALSYASESLRRLSVHEFLAINGEAEMFMRLPLCPFFDGGSEGEIILIIQKNIKYLKSLLPEMNGARYLNHAKRVHEEIELWEERLKNEEMEMVLRKLYR